MKFTISNCSNSDYNRLARAITDYNISQLPPNSNSSFIALGFVAKQSNWGAPLGGITAKIVLGNCLSIDILWVAENHRKQGLGSELLKTLEEAARGYGSHLSIVDTFDFQALDFYKKNGYATFGVLDDCPTPGHQRYYLSKKL